MYKFNLLDFPNRVSKSKLAKLFGLTRRSLHTYHDIALNSCDDFEEDYPIVGGKRYKESPLTIYQCWVLWGIYQWIHIEKLPRKVLEEYLSEDVDFQKKFSKKQFELLYPKYEKEEINNEFQILCGVA